ncbi:hypothetical protein LCGC14_2628480, partial [marine sediment metagenome]
VLQQWVQDSLRSDPVFTPPANSYEHPEPSNTDSQVMRSCQACSKAVNISEIRVVYYCPPCDIALKQAILDENTHNTSI